ncbi:Uncharacterised protein [Helicobacter pametensis]|nr:Uncharacterised protein [Helicobacter pametensis]
MLNNNLLIEYLIHNTSTYMHNKLTRVTLLAAQKSY